MNCRIILKRLNNAALVRIRARRSSLIAQHFHSRLLAMPVGSVSHNQTSGIEHFKPDLRMACAQGTLPPLSLELGQDLPPLGSGQSLPFDFGHQQPTSVFRIGRDEVEFDPALPISLGAGITRSTIILKHSRGMVMDEFLL